MIDITHEANSRHAVAVNSTQRHDCDRQDQWYTPSNQMKVRTLFVYPILYRAKCSKTHVPSVGQYDEPYHSCYQKIIHQDEDHDARQIFSAVKINILSNQVDRKTITMCSRNIPWFSCPQRSVLAAYNYISTARSELNQPANAG